MNGSYEIFGIKVFDYFGCDIDDTRTIKFYGVKFPFKSMKKFDSSTVSVFNNGIILIYDNFTGKALFNDHIITIPEFQDEIKEKYLSK